MPTYSVQLSVNVPGVGAKTFVKTDITSNSPEEAMSIAKADVKIEVPDRIDVNVGSSQPEQPASTPPAGSDTPPPTGT